MISKIEKLISDGLKVRIKFMGQYGRPPLATAGLLVNVCLCCEKAVYSSKRHLQLSVSPMLLAVRHGLKYETIESSTYCPCTCKITVFPYTIRTTLVGFKISYSSYRRDLCDL